MDRLLGDHRRAAHPQPRWRARARQARSSTSRRRHRSTRWSGGRRRPTRLQRIDHPQEIGETGSCWCARADFDRGARRSDRERDPLLATWTEGPHFVTAPDRIEVVDSGPGIQAGEEEAIFERFHRGSAPTGVRGPGPRVADRARADRGRGEGQIRIENRDGSSGARAVIELPAHSTVAAVGGELR